MGGIVIEKIFVNNHSKFLEKINMLNVNFYPLEEYKGAKVNIKCKCNACGHEWMTCPDNIYRGYGCPKCGLVKMGLARRKTNEEYVKQLHNINPNIIPLEKYTHSHTKIKFKCSVCGYEWIAQPRKVLETGKCPKCSEKSRIKSITKKHSVFEQEMSEVNPGIILLDEYTGSFTKIRCKCVKHDTIFEMDPSHLLKGQTGCKLCLHEKLSKVSSKDHDEFIKELESVNSNIEVIDKYTNVRTKIRVRCKICGHIWERYPYQFLRGYGCPKCSPSSRGEDKIARVLDSLGVEYIIHFRFDDLFGVRGGKLSYDFYIPKYNLLIEYQGQYHDHTVPSQTDDQFMVQQEHDRLKAEYVKNNNYNFLEIWYYDFDNIEKILMECLNDLENPVTTTAV